MYCKGNCSLLSFGRVTEIKKINVNIFIAEVNLGHFCKTA
jgi:hypothetical protein